jgi:hypothetical protein
MNGGPDGDLLDLVRSISHETFHKTDPFKHGRTSQYEELWARHISGVITNDINLIFNGDMDRFLETDAIKKAWEQILGPNYSYQRLAYFPSPFYETIYHYQTTPSSPMEE